MTERVLVRAPSWLGDFVMSTPTLRALDAALGADLTVVAPRRFLALLDSPAARARRVALEDGEPSSAWRGHATALLLVNSFRSAWAARRAGARRVIGQSRDLRGWLLTDRFAPARERGEVPLGLGRAGRWPRRLPRPFASVCAELATALGVVVRDSRPRLFASEVARQAASERLARHRIAGDYAIANVGGRAGSAKNLPAELWRDALDRFACRFDRPVLLACGPGEDELALTLAEQLARGSARARSFVALIDPVAELDELVALDARAAICLTTDTGLRHVAAAAGAKVAVALGPTDPRHTADHLERTVLERVVVDCGPCHRERCPLHGERAHRCMRSIDVERFARRAFELASAVSHVGGELAPASRDGDSASAPGARTEPTRDMPLASTADAPSALAHDTRTALARDSRIAPERDAQRAPTSDAQRAPARDPRSAAPGSSPIESTSAHPDRDRP